MQFCVDYSEEQASLPDSRSLFMPTAIPFTDKAIEKNCRTSKDESGSAFREKEETSTEIKALLEEQKWIPDEISSLHGTHDNSLLSEEEDEEMGAHACFECQSARVRLRVPQQLAHQLGFTKKLVPRDELPDRALKELEYAYSDFSYHQYQDESGDVEHTRDQASPSDNEAYDQYQNHQQQEEVLCDKCGQMAESTSLSRPHGPFKQVKKRMAAHKRIYMIESCNSSNFDISQEIFKHIDSDDDHFFQSEFLEDDLSSSRASEDSSVYSYVETDPVCTGKSQAVSVAICVFLYSIVVVYIAVFHPKYLSGHVGPQQDQRAGHLVHQ